MFRIIKLGTTEKLIIAITTSQFSTGAKYTASSITATFYKVNAGGSALEIDTAIGTSGVVTLSADTGSKTGFHTALLDVSALTAKVYCVVFEATIDSVAAISHEFLDISAERKKIADYLDASVDTISTNLLRALGLMMENHVEDDITRNSSGYKTSSIIYIYNSAANATTHDKATGLTASYTVSATYNGSNQVTLFKVVKN